LTISIEMFGRKRPPSKKKGAMIVTLGVYSDQGHPMTNGRGRSGRLPVTSLPMIFKPLAGEATQHGTVRWSANEENNVMHGVGLSR